MTTLRELTEQTRAEFGEGDAEQELADLLFEMDEHLDAAGFEVEDDGTLTVEEYIALVGESLERGELSEFIGAVATGASLASKGLKMVFGKLVKVGQKAKGLLKKGVSAVKREYHATQASRYKRKASAAGAIAARHAGKAGGPKPVARPRAKMKRRSPKARSASTPPKKAGRKPLKRKKAVK